MVTMKWILGITDDELAQIHEIRRTVFIVEQSIAEEDEIVPWEDEVSQHLIIYEGDVAVATGRVLSHEGKFILGRVAVLKEHRGKGYGKLAVVELIEKALTMGAAEIEIHAQSYLVEFYQGFGFEICSEEYEEAGIMHFTMVLKGCAGYSRLK